MIIDRVESKDVLKYESLSLNGLPAEGLIGVSGMNESGKSTIGETICFALYGRTFSLDEQDLTKVIRWGATRCQVEVDFTLQGERRLRVLRLMDNEGNHGAQLFDLAVSGDQPIARGAKAVSEEIIRLIGFGYNEFVESFYLAQREMSAPHPHSQAVKSMAGVTTYENLSVELRKTVDDVQADIESTGDDRDQAAEQILSMNIDPEQLAALQAEREPFAEAVTNLHKQIDSIGANVPAYAQAHQAAGKARGKRRWLRLAVFLATLAVAALWLVWAAVGPAQGQSWAGGVRDSAAAYLPGWDSWEGQLNGVAIGATALWVLLLAAAAGLSGRLRRLSASGIELADNVDQGAEWLDQAAEDAAISTQGFDPLAMRASSAKLRQMALPPDVCQTEMIALSGALQTDLETFQSEVQRVDEEIAEEEGRLRRVEDLQAIVVRMEERQQEHKHRLRVLETAIGLLAGAARHVSQRFNGHVRDEVSRTLPLFTEARYEHMKIDDNLDVRVFSSDKRDFMNLDEVSSGTQRQIMLALRLALSQQLVNATVQGQQFSFLDEPFAFFDQTRMRAALEALPKISNELAQIFVIAQEFPDGVDFDAHIECDRDTAVLSFG